MFIAFVLIILFTLLGVLIGVYSIFSPFVQNLGDVIDFNSAYYGALAGVERANLALKYKNPGFEGSGGFFGSTRFGPQSDTITGNFGILTRGNNGVSRQIQSRTTKIPSAGNGNVDKLLASTDSNNYNKLPYFTSEKIFLSLDNTPSDATVYTATTASKYFTGGYFFGSFRLPPKAVAGFGNVELCVDRTNSLCDPDGDDLFDEALINRSLKGYRSGVPFTIIPNSSIFYYSGMQIDENRDTAIRESIINNSDGFVYFGKDNNKYSFNIINQYSNNLLNKHNIISPSPTGIDTLSFRTLLTNADTGPTTGLEFGFSIVDKMRSANGNIFPFLEYQLEFASPVSDRFYTIQGESIVGNYDVKIILKKATNSDSPIADFTVIF